MTTPGGMTRPPKKNIDIDKMFRGFVRAVQELYQTGDAFHAKCHMVDKVGELSKPRMIPVCDKRRDSPYGRHVSPRLLLEWAACSKGSTLEGSNLTPLRLLC